MGKLRYPTFALASALAHLAWSAVFGERSRPAGRPKYCLCWWFCWIEPTEEIIDIPPMTAENSGGPGRADKELATVIEKLRGLPQQKVKLGVVDIDGVLRGKVVHKDKALSALSGGFGFCNVIFGWDSADVCYENSDIKYTGWHTGYPDADAVIDPSTFRTVPWDDDIPFLLADFPGTDVCPRQLYRRVLSRAESLGYQVFSSLEFEFFNFDETAQSLSDKGFAQLRPLTPGMFGYSLQRAGVRREYFNAIMDEMLAFGVPIEGLHTETGPGVYEVAIAVCMGIEAGDRGALFKAGIKEIANRFGVVPSFMAKWNAQLPGCSGHIHQSLWQDGKGCFHDDQHQHKMSKTFEHYLAGQLMCLPDILPMFAPNVNSYKRLTDGMWAPTRVAWSVDNRTAALRVIPGNEKSTRLETRVSGSDVNPYLALAAAVASGLYGIDKQLPLTQEAVVGNAYTRTDFERLPVDLGQATEKMAQSELARTLFGDGFVDHYTGTRRWEWQQYSKAVTSWELQRYFEVI